MGQDFSMYKKSTLMRCIERRKGLYQIEKIQNYVRFLQENLNEIEFHLKNYRLVQLVSMGILQFGLNLKTQ
ncbi:hypothetical protein [Flavobacterium fryxellicola]